MIILIEIFNIIVAIYKLKSINNSIEEVGMPVSSGRFNAGHILQALVPLDIKLISINIVIIMRYLIN